MGPRPHTCDLRPDASVCIIGTHSDGDPARHLTMRAAGRRVHVGSLLTRETADHATHGHEPMVRSSIRPILVRTLFPDTRPYDVFHG